MTPRQREPEAPLRFFVYLSSVGGDTYEPGFTEPPGLLSAILPPQHCHPGLHRLAQRPQLSSRRPVRTAALPVSAMPASAMFDHVNVNEACAEGYNTYNIVAIRRYFG